MGKMIQCKSGGRRPPEKAPGHFIRIGMRRQQQTRKPVNQIEFVFKIHNAVVNLDQPGGHQQTFRTDGVLKVFLGNTEKLSQNLTQEMIRGLFRPRRNGALEFRKYFHGSGKHQQGLVGV